MDDKELKELLDFRRETNDKEYSWVKNCVSVIAILLGLLISLKSKNDLSGSLESKLYIATIISNGLCILSGLLFLYADTDTDHRVLQQHIKKLRDKSNQVTKQNTFVGQRKIFSLLRICFIFTLIVSVLSLMGYGILGELY